MRRNIFIINNRGVNAASAYNEGTEYFYNANGALTKDLNKGISKIEYDVLDNLCSITFNNGFKTKYVYDASGSKLRTIHEALTTNTTDYIGDFIFEDGKLSKYQFEGGYCSFDSNLNPTYHYFEKDHLGSIRMVVNENGTIEQVNHYYPFGGVYGDLAYNSELQRNKYIGKEFDHTSGLDWYDHGARMYDAAKGSWDKIDFFANKYYSFNPYLYCRNNPIILFDLNGREWKYTTDQNGNIHITVDIFLLNNLKSYDYDISGFKQNLSYLFNNALAKASQGKVTGEVTYNGKQIKGQVTPIMSLYAKTGKDTGITIGSESGVNICDANGKIKPTMTTCSDALHELFHTILLHHPFEKNDAKDTELIKAKDGYITTPNTDSNIIM